MSYVNYPFSDGQFSGETASRAAGFSGASNNQRDFGHIYKNYIPPKVLGGLGIYGERFVRQNDTGVDYATARLNEGWGLTVNSFIRGNMPQDPKVIAALVVKAGVIARTLATKRFVPMAAASEILAIITPIPGDEILNFPVMATLAASGVIGVLKERRRLQGRR